MEVSHYEEANASGDKTDDLNFIIRGDAIGEIFRNLAIKDHYKSAGNKDKYTNKEPANTKSPINHKNIITQKDSPRGVF